MASRNQQAPRHRVLSSTLVLGGLLASSTLSSAQAQVPDSAPSLQGELLAEVAYTSRPSAVSPKPNIVVLMLDDIGAIDDRVWERLPKIRKRFLQQGIKATQFHVETPTCTPGRVGFLTGLHTHHHRATRNVGSLFRPSMSIATQLRKRGYYTILGGKYLNGYESITPKVPPGWSEFHAMTSGYYDYDIWSNGVRQHRGKDARDYSTDVVSRKISASLTRAPKDKPVFIWAAPWAAHQPRVPAPRHKDDPRCYGIDRWKPPGFMERDVSDKPGYIRRLPLRSLGGKWMQPTCRTLLAVDDMLGRITWKLWKQGRLKNTLFILTSDNGMNYGMHRAWDDKKTPYATQVPFLISWKKRIAADRPNITERLQNIDLAPTLCELAGCKLGAYPTGQTRPDGRSFADLLLGRSKRLGRTAVLASFRTAGAWVPRWFGVETTLRSPLASTGCELAAAGKCRWSYTRYESGAKELYDISNGPCWKWQPGDPGDPCRLRNVAGWKRYAKVEKALRERLATMKER